MDLHGQNSQQFRRNTFTAEDIFESLEIDGYHVILHDTWQLSDQPRIIVFASNNITVKMREIPVSVRDSPNITVGTGHGAKVLAMELKPLVADPRILASDLNILPLGA